MTDLSTLTRTELDAIASDLGLDPADYANKSEIIAAIDNAAPQQGTEPVEPSADEYPAYMDMVAGERAEDAEEPEEPLSGFTLVRVNGEEGDPQQGETIFFNTDANADTVVEIRVTDADGNPLHQQSVPGGPERTPHFNLGPSALWPEGSYGGPATAQLLAPDSEGNLEMLDELSFDVGPEAPEEV